MSRQNEPQDKACLAGIICFILGLGTLLPWNFFITAIPYFHWRLYNNSSANGNISASENSGKDDLNFNNWMTLLAQLPLLLCTLLNSFIYQCISQRIRIAGSMLAILALFILTAVLVKIEMDPQTTFFSLTLATIWFINAFCAILQGSLFGLLTLFPQKYSSLFLSGQGMAGMFAALAMILSMLSGADHTTIALSYFITPCIGTCISIICYLLLPRLDFAQHYLSKSNTNSSKSYEMETKTELLHQGEENGDAAQRKAVLLLKEAEACIAEENMNVSICTILKKIWVMALTIVLTFGVTLSVFPAITTKVVTNVHNNENWSNFFTPVCCFLIFNVMDFFGRWLTSKTLWPGPDCKYLPLMAASRFIFVPLFMFCNINADRHYLSSFFVNDAWFIIFMAFFSVSNGYFVSLPMCLAPKKVLPHESETTGALMTFFLALGLSVGAGLSFAFKELL